MLVHKFRKRKREVFRKLTTSIPRKETRVDPMMVQPKHATNTVEQTNADLRAREPVPTIDGQTMPRQRAIQDSSWLVASIKDKPNLIGMKELSAGNNKDSCGVSLNPICKLSYRREPTRAFDEQNDTPNNHVKHNIDRRVQKCSWYSHPTKGRCFARSQHALGKKERKV